MTLTPLHAEIVLDRPDIDEVRDFTSLIIRIRDENDVGINVEFEPHPIFYSKTDESYAPYTASDFAENVKPYHWLYVANRSSLLSRFRSRNPQLPHEWDVKHYLVLTQSDIIDVIATAPPKVFPGSDGVRGWIRPGELRSE